MNFDELKDAIHHLREQAKPFVKENKKEVNRVIEQKIRDYDYLDHLLDQSLELCYSSDDHSGYLSLVEYIRSFDSDFANEHYKFYYDWFLKEDIDGINK